MTVAPELGGGQTGLAELKRLVSAVIDHLGRIGPGHGTANRIAATGSEGRDAGLPPRISLRPEEAALVTGLSLSTIKRALADGSLPSKRLRDMRLIRMADLNAWVDSLEDA